MGVGEVLGMEFAHEVKVVFKGGGVISSVDMTVKVEHIIRDQVIRKRVPAYPVAVSGDSFTCDFGELKFRYQRGRIHVFEDRTRRFKSVWIGGRKAFEGVDLVHRVFMFNLPLSSFYSAAPKARRVREKPLRKVSLTYYMPESSSFQFISEHHVRCLLGVGMDARRRKRDDLMWKGTRGSAEWGLLHPTFSFFQSVERLRGRGAVASLDVLRKAHKRLGGFDIADSSRISPLAVKMANQMDLMIVPSKCSQAAFKRSGVETPVRVVPHGLSENYSASAMPSKRVPKAGWKVLYFLMHSPRRKGVSVVHRAMSQILKKLKGVRLVVKTGAGKRLPEVSALANLPRTTVIDRWLSEKQLVKLYDACDVLLCPSLGGGFELNVLEGLARGLIPITSDWPAIREYADPHAFIIDDLEEKVKPYLRNAIHTGYGANPDSEHLYGLVYHTFENRASLKRHAENYAEGFREQYTWESVARRIAQCLK